jgi:hypothetical protein
MLLIGKIFCGIGIICAILMIVMGVNMVNAKINGAKTDAVITDIETRTVHHNGETNTTRDVYVLYEVDGIPYEKVLGYYTMGMRRGKTITVYYDPQNPDKLLNGSVVPIILCIPLLAAFGGFGYNIIKRERERGVYINGLIAEDKYVVVDSDGIEENSNLTVNNVCYRCMRYKYTDKETGNEYEFVSNPYHPERCPFTKGMPVKVYVDLEQDPTVHYVCEDY